VVEYDESRASISSSAVYANEAGFSRVSCAPSSISDHVLCANMRMGDTCETVAILSLEKPDSITHKYSFDSKFETVKALLWECAETVVICDKHGVSKFEVEGGKRATSITTDCILRSASIDPHLSHTVACTMDRSILLWDARANDTIIRTIKTTNYFPITSLDINPNRPHMYMTGSEDGRISFYDLRFTKVTSVRAFDAHNHHVTCTKFNVMHDEYIVSGGTDCDVCLWKCEDISGAALESGSPLTASNRNTTTRRNSYSSNSSVESPMSIKGVVRASKKTSGHFNPLVCRYTRHEDSVDSVCWSYASPWVFASVSWDGSVMVNAVPINENFNAN
jgi:WD40 repeat protein